MDFDLFRRTIDDASEVGVRKIRLYLHGEPMLHPRIVDMVDYIKKAGLAVHVITNGTLFTRDRSEAILSSGVTFVDRITFSILGFSRQVHEKVMREVDHERVRENLFALLELRAERRLNGLVMKPSFMPCRRMSTRKNRSLNTGVTWSITFRLSPGCHVNSQTSRMGKTTAA